MIFVISVNSSEDLTQNSVEIAVKSDLLAIYKALRSTKDVKNLDFLKNDHGIDLKITDHQCVVNKLKLSSIDDVAALAIDNFEEFFDRTENNKRKLNLFELATKPCRKSYDDELKFEFSKFSQFIRINSNDIDCLKWVLYQIEPKSLLLTDFNKINQSVELCNDVYQNFIAENKIFVPGGLLSAFNLRKCAEEEILRSDTALFTYLKMGIAVHDNLNGIVIEAVRNDYRNYFASFAQRSINCILSDLIQSFK